MLFPNCKINLGLRIKDKRTDGYHNLETIFFPLPLSDAAELVYTGTPSSAPSVSDPLPPSRRSHNTYYPPAVSAKDGQEPFELILSGRPLPGTPGENLCTRAWEMIKNDFPWIPPLRMYLQKTIPTGGGLGGGSSDGTHTLLLLNSVLKLQLSHHQLQEYAERLGSDCPFFLLNKPCLATGRGEVLEELTLDLQDYFFVLVDPQIPVSTAWAFSQILPSNASGPALKEIVSLPVPRWKEFLVNEFESPVHKHHPLLSDLKEKLYRAGAVYASMTGTGSCIYGIFEQRSDAVASVQQYLQPYSVHILNRHP